MKVSANILPEQVSPKFKIGNVVYSNKILGEYVITHIYLKNGIISYKVKTYMSQFLLMSNELSGKAIPTDTLLIDEEFLILVK